MIRLGVNIDHVATLRQVRGTPYPDPVQAALLAVQGGADSITVHLREDRRHIQPRDVLMLSQVLQVPLNLEMAVTEEMVNLACEIRPEFCCLVPEKREELTTEGGLNVVGDKGKIRKACAELAKAGIQVSLFVDPNEKQIAAAAECGAPVIELHTGAYAEADSDKALQRELELLEEAAEQAEDLGLIVNAGHGLHYYNTRHIAEIPNIHELNIGHSIMAEAIMIGMEAAVRKMKTLIVEARRQSLHDITTMTIAKLLGADEHEGCTH